MRTLLLFLLLGGAAGAQDLLVISPKPFWEAAKEWRAHREAQGHAIAFREPAEDLPKLVREVAAGGRLRSVLLLGDMHHVGCAYHEGVFIRPYERDFRIATDHPLSDLDGDNLPDLAVGRIPADNPDEARAMLGRIVAYERSRDFGAWRRRVNVFAGVGGFGALQDWALEQVARKFLTENVGLDFDLHVTYANPSSPFCPPPARVGETMLERFNEGALAVAYLGHGSRNHLDRVAYGGRRFDILPEEAVYSIDCKRGPPIAIFVACSTGHFDGAPDCLAEHALRQPRGPVAVIASSRVSMPYANGVLGKELLDALFLQRLPTLGEVWVQAKRRLVAAAEGDAGRQFIEMLAMGYQMREDLRTQERAEHLYLYHLFGDPAMRLPLPRAATIEPLATSRPGSTVTITGSAPVEGAALAELLHARSAPRAARADDSDAGFRACYEKANDWVRASAKGRVANGRFAIELALPKDLPPGPHPIRLFVEGSDGAASAAAQITIE